MHSSEKGKEVNPCETRLGIGDYQRLFPEMHKSEG